MNNIMTSSTSSMRSRNAGAGAPPDSDDQSPTYSHGAIVETETGFNWVDVRDRDGNPPTPTSQRQARRSNPRSMIFCNITAQPEYANASVDELRWAHENAFINRSSVLRYDHKNDRSRLPLLDPARTSAAMWSALRNNTETADVVLRCWRQSEWKWHLNQMLEDAEMTKSELNQDKELVADHGMFAYMESLNWVKEAFYSRARLEIKKKRPFSKTQRKRGDGGWGVGVALSASPEDSFPSRNDYYTVVPENNVMKLNMTSTEGLTVVPLKNDYSDNMNCQDAFRYRNLIEVSVAIQKLKQCRDRGGVRSGRVAIFERCQESSQTCSEQDDADEKLHVHCHKLVLAQHCSYFMCRFYRSGTKFKCATVDDAGVVDVAFAKNMEPPGAKEVEAEVEHKEDLEGVGESGDDADAKTHAIEEGTSDFRSSGDSPGDGSSATEQQERQSEEALHPMPLGARTISAVAEAGQGRGDDADNGSTSGDIRRASRKGEGSSDTTQDSDFRAPVLSEDFCFSVCALTLLLDYCYGFQIDSEDITSSLDVASELLAVADYYDVPDLRVAVLDMVERRLAKSNRDYTSEQRVADLLAADFYGATVIAEMIFDQSRCCPAFLHELLDFRRTPLWNDAFYARYVDKFSFEKLSLDELNRAVKPHVRLAQSSHARRVLVREIHPVAGGIGGAK